MPKSVSSESVVETLLKDLEVRLGLFFEGLIAKSPRQVSDVIEVARDFTLNAGKRLRPKVLLTSYLGYGGSETENALLLSVSLEVMHNFLLIHDDIIDNSDVRRGRPTVHRFLGDKFGDGKLGRDLALVAGDIIAFEAIGLLGHLKVPGEVLGRLVTHFSECYVLTGFGQTLDVLYSGRFSPELIDSSIPEQMSVLKTAYYTFAHPLMFGYILAGGEDEGEISLLKALGEKLGLAFQYRDDLHGIFGGADKSANDITEGKFTPIVKFALTHFRDFDSEKFSTMIGLLGKQRKSEADVEMVRTLVSISGVVERISDQIRRLVDEAREIVRTLKISEDYGNLLMKTVERTLRG